MFSLQARLVLRPKQRLTPMKVYDRSNSLLAAHSVMGILNAREASRGKR